jgi:hypothetical protein
VRLIRWLAGVGAALLALQASGGPSTAFVSPSTLSASLQATLPTMLTWTVRVQPVVTFAAPPTLTLTSPQGFVTTPDGQVLQVDPVALTVRVPSGGQASAAESFTLAPATIAAALHLGVGTLRLTRTFGVAPYAAVASVEISLGGSASGPLTLARVALHFEDRELLRVLGPGESAVAIAEISYSGGGTLNGLWEVASPPSTRGQPVFVPLGSASLDLEGGGITELTSPPLPSQLAGSYLVRFRVREPVVPFQGLVLQYAVEDDDAMAPPITVLSPEQHATLAAGTRFAWQPAPGAVAYRLEFYAADAAAGGRPPLSGQWVPSADNDAALSVLAQTHLEPGHAYRWRIVAISAESQVVGRSALYEIRTP